MTQSGDLHVSSRGQMSLPASARNRWGLQPGGQVAYLDLGDVVVLVPGRLDDLRSSLLDTVTDEDWQRSREGFGDRELANE